MILNFRDVAATVNDVAGKPVLGQGRLFRSARLEDASPEELRALSEQQGIRTVLDLRTETEILQHKQERRGQPPEDESKDPMQSQPKYYNINLNGHGYAKTLTQRLSWPRYLQLIALMAARYRTQGIRILVEDVMQQRGLVGLAVDSIDSSGEEILQVFKLLEDPQTYPVLIHCTQGKDRTGLIVALVLLLLGTPIDAVNSDYMISERELEGEREARLAELHSIGLGDEFARCDPSLIESVDKHLRLRYGSVEDYLNGLGVDEEMQAGIRSRLSAAAVPPG